MSPKVELSWKKDLHAGAIFRQQLRTPSFIRFWPLAFLTLIALFTPIPLTYANDPSYDWQVVEIDDGIDPPYTPYRRDQSLALDSAGNPHICFGQNEVSNNDGPGHIFYTYREEGVWHSEELASMTRSSAETSIGIDNNNHVHLAYAAEYGHGIWYITNKDGDWRVYPLLTSDWYWTANYVSLAMDDLGNPHMCYSFYQWQYGGGKRQTYIIY